ncbi:MAG: ATP-binding protein [Clostridiales bacterium]|nr:ATP-binding protein [Clostridiales bacterium]
MSEMGIYLNPGNKGFQAIRNGNYVDKTGLIQYVNRTINVSPDRLTCFSRPRRFGKSFAAKMLCAYYDKSCDSHPLFDGLEISRTVSYEEHLNQYNVLYLDITGFISRSNSTGTNVVTDIQTIVLRELRAAFPEYVAEKEIYLPDALSSICHETENRFIIIIDEWDALFREAKNDTDVQKKYIQLLRGLFKNGSATDEMIAAAYITGILPIKKYGTESALTDFQEFTMLNADLLTPYVGFTEPEVKKLCSQSGMDFEKMKCWYDGYSFKDTCSIYSPNSVMSAIRRGSFRSYWTSSETYESLHGYISMNFDGLKDAVIAMLGGEKIRVHTDKFQNDMTSFKSRDDVLTLLIHLGYLAFDETSGEVFIPNLEVAGVFQDAVEGNDWREVEKTLYNSENLLKATIRGDTAAVETALEEVHNMNFSILKYNDENSLSCAITLAYFTARNYYEIVRELPAGKGFADLAFIPYKNMDMPALLVELKYDREARTAIRQIRENHYEGRLKKYFGNLLLVGVSYEKNAGNKNGKKHTCIIEKA